MKITLENLSNTLGEKAKLIINGNSDITGIVIKSPTLRYHFAVAYREKSIFPKKRIKWANISVSRFSFSKVNKISNDNEYITLYLRALRGGSYKVYFPHQFEEVDVNLKNIGL